MTSDQLDHWFTYHATTEETAPKYAAIGRAQLDADFAVSTCCAADNTEPAHVNHENVNAVMRAFAVAVDTIAPDCADKTAAIRCIRLARNAANEAIVMPKGAPRLIAIAHTELQKARWQANSAIACGGK
jgi:hypothetical protein